MTEDEMVGWLDGITDSMDMSLSFELCPSTALFPSSSRMLVRGANTFPWKTVCGYLASCLRMGPIGLTKNCLPSMCVFV